MCRRTIQFHTLLVQDSRSKITLKEVGIGLLSLPVDVREMIVESKGSLTILFGMTNPTATHFSRTRACKQESSFEQGKRTDLRNQFNRCPAFVTGAAIEQTAGVVDIEAGIGVIVKWAEESYLCSSMFSWTIVACFIKGCMNVHCLFSFH